MKLALPLTGVAIATILAACGGAATTTAAGPLKAVSGGLGQGGAAGPSQAYGGATLDRSQSTTAPNAVSDPVLQAQSAQKLIQDATVTLKISKGSFDSVSRRIVDIAQGAGGLLFSMQTSQSDQDVINSGSVTVKVPSDQYTRVLDQLRSLGTVTAIQTNSQDVSGEYVDLSARLKNQQAQQAILIALMAKATTIQDSIAVQNQLSQVTGEVERIEARIRFLDTQTTYATVNVNLIIPGVAVKPSEPGLWEKSGIGDAFGTAIRLSANVISGMIIVVGFLLPFAVIAVLVLAAWRFLPKRVLPLAR
jgi:Domain of unknown function (DUF4349)